MFIKFMTMISFVFFLGLIFPFLYAEKKEDLKVHDGTMRRGRRS